MSCQALQESVGLLPSHGCKVVKLSFEKTFQWIPALSGQLKEFARVQPLRHSEASDPRGAGYCLREMQNSVSNTWFWFYDRACTMQELWKVNFQADFTRRLERPGSVLLREQCMKLCEGSQKYSGDPRKLEMTRHTEHLKRGKRSEQN